VRNIFEAWNYDPISLHTASGRDQHIPNGGNVENHPTHHLKLDLILNSSQIDNYNNYYFHLSLHCNWKIHLASTLRSAFCPPVLREEPWALQGTACILSEKFSTSREALVSHGTPHSLLPVRWIERHVLLSAYQHRMWHVQQEWHEPTEALTLKYATFW